jgi:hypothetical protein
MYLRFYSRDRSDGDKTLFIGPRSQAPHQSVGRLLLDSLAAIGCLVQYASPMPPWPPVGRPGSPITVYAFSQTMLRKSGPCGAVNWTLFHAYKHRQIFCRCFDAKGLKCVQGHFQKGTRVLSRLVPSRCIRLSVSIVSRLCFSCLSSSIASTLASFRSFTRSTPPPAP